MLDSKPRIISEKIPSKLEIITQSVDSLTQKIKEFGVSEKEIFNIRLCLDEALVNAARHGNELNPDLFVYVHVELKGRVLTLEVKDEGQGFDFKSLPDPTKNDNILKTSGRGVYLIRKLMDEVKFFDCGRGIKMIKLLHKGGVK